MAKKKTPKKGKRKPPRKEPAPPANGRPREIDREEVLRLHREGLFNKAIAKKMGISAKSVRRALDELLEGRRPAATAPSPAKAGEAQLPPPPAAESSAPPSAPGFCPPNLLPQFRVNYSHPGVPPGAVSKPPVAAAGAPVAPGMRDSGAHQAVPGASGGPISERMGASGGASAVPVPLLPEELATWRRRFVTTLVGRYLAADLLAAERTEALRSLEILLNKCSPEAVPTKAAVQAVLAGPLAPYRERYRRAAEEQRREMAYRLVNGNLPIDLSREDYPRIEAAMEALFAARPDATAEELAEEVLAPLHLASRKRKARKAYMEAARRDIENRWETEVILLKEEDRQALRRHWERTLEAKDQARIDFLKVLAREEGLRAYGMDMAKMVEERLAALVAELIPK